MNTFASRILAATAEETIREAIDRAKVTLGKPFYIKVKFNGKTVPFCCWINRLPTAAQQMRGMYAKVTLQTLYFRPMLKGLPPTWNIHQFVLDGKNRLKEDGLPKATSEEYAKDFFKNCGIPMPKVKR